MLPKTLQRWAIGLAVGLTFSACQAAAPTQPVPAVAGFRIQADFGRATTKAGASVDLVNILFIGSRWDVASAFHKAGWLEADPITPANVARQGKALLGKSYPTAPFSNLYVNGRVQDLAFQKNSEDIHKRDHLRLWLTTMQAADGRPVWLCAASRDIGIGFSRHSPTLVTHKVEVNRDLERDMVVEDLQNTGHVQQLYWLSGEPVNETKPTPIESDGRVALIALKPQWTLFGW